MSTPQITVVVCTYNRADVVARTVDAVLAQEGPTVEVVVVDDGSTDATPKVLRAIDHPRLRVARQDNAGLSVARNLGTASATGEWLVFLDDDDVPDPGWLAALAGPMGDPGVGVTCCGSLAVDPDGNLIAPMPVVVLPAPFGGVVGSYRAGTFAVRADLYDRAGGYLDGLGTSHQFELFMRLQATAEREGLRIESTDVNLLRIERRPVNQRDSSNPYVIYDATSWIIARHPVAFATAPGRLAAFEGVRGAAIARAGAWDRARRHFWRSARLEPRRARGWGRWTLTLVPFVGRRVWNRGRTVAYDPASSGLLHQAPGITVRRPELFLSWEYRENPPTGTGTGTDTGPGPGARLSRFAARLARRHRGSPVVGPGTLETADDPIAVLHDLALRAGSAPVLVVVHDQEARDPDRPHGPPSDPSHRREWSAEQIDLLVRSTGFRVERSWRHGGEVVLRAVRVTIPDEAKATA